MSPRGIFNKTHPSLGAFVEIKNHTAAPLPSVSCAGGADPALEFIVLKHRMRLCRRCRLRLCGGGRDTIYSTGRLSVYAMLSLGTGRALHALHKPCIGSDAVCKTAALTTCHTRARSRQSALHSKVTLSVTSASTYMSTSSRFVTGMRPGTACHLAASACFLSASFC